MARYVAIGPPINAVEAQGIRRLRDALPEHYTVIGNFELQLPRRRNTMEFDAVVVGEFGIWVVEIKGWSGRIEGDQRRWNLEWGPVQNPLIRIEYKAKALRHFLMESLSLPNHFFCESVVLLPLRVDVQIDDPRRDKVITVDQIDAFFDDRDRIYEQGPGPLIDAVFREQLLGTIAPVVCPRVSPVEVTGYEVEAELIRHTMPYREFVGSHKLLRSRSKVRIKRFEMDPLQPAGERKRAYNRVLRDMEALGRLEDNPYVARAYEVIQDRSNELVFYLVSEWIGAETLSGVIEARNGINPNRIAVHLIKAVGFMHEQGIIHRRLHPGVVFLASTLSVPFKIADFDFSRVSNLPSIATDFDELRTQGYSAPELWMEDCQEYDHRVDLYSVGVIIAEIFMERRLFPTLSSMMDHVEVWQEARKEFDPVVAEVLDGFLAPDPANRRPDLALAVEMFEFRSKNI